MSENSQSENNSGFNSFTLEVSNKMGVHARPAAMIVRITSRYDGEIWVTKEDERIAKQKEEARIAKQQKEAQIAKQKQSNVN